MCAFCAMLSGGEAHWTEAGTNAGSSSEIEGGRARYLNRLYRVGLMNRVLDYYGCAAEDWANNNYIVRSRSGRTVIVDQLPQVWMTVDGIAGKQTDPLDSGLLAALRQRDPASPG